jgi:hypothetical protein
VVAKVTTITRIAGVVRAVKGGKLIALGPATTAGTVGVRVISNGTRDPKATPTPKEGNVMPEAGAERWNAPTRTSTETVIATTAETGLKKTSGRERLVASERASTAVNRDISLESAPRGESVRLLEKTTKGLVQ